jgi:hypothetical protein
MLDQNFRITGSVNIENVSLLWVYKWGNSVSLPYNIVNGKISGLEITKNYVKGSASASSTLMNTNKLLRADGFCHVDLGAKTVLIRQTKGGVDNSSFFIDRLNFTFGGKLLEFNIKNMHAELTDLMPLVGLIPAKLYGMVEGSLSFAGGLYNGSLSLRDCGWDPQTKLVSDLQTTLTIHENIFKKTDIPFKFYGNPCLLSIASADRSLSKLYINLSSENVAIDLNKNKFSSSDEPINVPLEITGIMNVKQFTYHPHTIHNVQLQYGLSGNNFTLKGFQFLFANGKISGKGAVSIPRGPSQASLSLNFNNLLVQEIIKSNEKIRNRFFGVLQGNAKVAFELSDKILETARGNVEFTIDKGKLVDTGIQNGLGMILAELKYKLRDLEFNKIYGNIDIRGTTYHIKSFIFNSNEIRLKVTGSFDRNLIASPLNIGLEFTRSFIQDLPNASVLVLGKYLRGEWYMVPFIMNGDMTESNNMKRLD